MIVTIEERDLVAVADGMELSIIQGEKPDMELGPDLPNRAELLMRKIPAAMARIIDSAEPDGFCASSFQIDVELSGAPFGIGISGKASITYVRNA